MQGRGSKILIILLIILGLGCKPTKHCAAYPDKHKVKFKREAVGTHTWI